jgi:hypothetical protein
LLGGTGLFFLTQLNSSVPIPYPPNAGIVHDDPQR